MAEIQPFHGVLYHTGKVNPSEVLTQPYDKITPDMRERYLARSPCNLVRIELGKDQPGDNESTNKYTRAAALYRQWRAEGVLRRSPLPALYYLEQTFTVPGTDQLRTRTGVIARVRLHRWDEGIILPHEHTLSKPKADRLALLQAVQVQHGQIFMLYPPPSRPVLARPGSAPTLEAVDDYGVVNRLWEVTAPDAIAGAQAALADTTLYIADGHHRYETALAYRDQAQTEASRYVMATLVDMTDAGLVILPTHRTVSQVSGFDRRQFVAQLARSFAVSDADGPQTAAGRIGMFDGTRFYRLTPMGGPDWAALFDGKPPLWDRLDVAILHVAILEKLLGIDEVRLREEANVAYWREAESAIAEVREGRAQLAFFLPPTPVTAVKAVADARSRMPQKSTDFYPKLLSGMTMYELSDQR